MRICWLSAPPFAKTGYGRQTNEIVSRLVDRGMDVECVGGGMEAVWGGVIYLGTKGGKTFVVRPTMGRLGGADVIAQYQEKYKWDCIITLWDSFVVNIAQNIRTPVIHYIPIDAPFTRRMADYVAPAFKVVAYSKFGYSELLKWFSPRKLDYIPHGVDTEVFKPSADEEKKQLRLSLYPKSVDPSNFMFLAVAANVGERKQLPNLMIAFKKLLKKTNREDLILYIYSNIQTDYPRGYDLIALANDLGILKYLRFPDFNTILDPWEDEQMAPLYSAADCFVTPTLGEGFGLPIAESMSCGTPVIGSNCSTLPELIQDHGWLVNTIDDYTFVPVWIPTLQQYPVPSEKHFIECMEDALTDEEKRLKFGRASREFVAANYDWEKADIVNGWIRFLGKVETELETTRTLTSP